MNDFEDWKQPNINKAFVQPNINKDTYGNRSL